MKKLPPKTIDEAVGKHSAGFRTEADGFWSYATPVEPEDLTGG